MSDKGAEQPAKSSSIDVSKFWQPGCNDRSSTVVFQKPKEIGAFSIDGKRKFHHNTSQLSYKKHLNSTQGIDLNDGFGDRFIKRDDNIKDRLNHILRWMVCNLHRFKKPTLDRPGNLGDFPDFLLWRGHMTKLMCTPYENQEGWEMAAQKLGNTIYISEVETKEAEKRRLDSTDKEKLMMYWGVRFEKYMTTNEKKEDTDIPPKKIARLASQEEDVVVNTNEAYCSVLLGKINSHSFIHGAEVDCCRNGGSSVPPDSYIELKTSRRFSSRRQEDNFHKFKTKKWWAQSFLAGVPQITCGFRDDKGQVVEILDFKTLDFPRMAGKVPGGGWDANLCLQFLENFFSKVKTVVGSSNDVFLFSWSPGKREIVYEQFKTPSSHAFLPEWYTTSLKYSG